MFSLFITSLIIAACQYTGILPERVGEILKSVVDLLTISGIQ